MPDFHLSFYSTKSNPQSHPNSAAEHMQMIPSYLIFSGSHRYSPLHLPPMTHLLFPTPTPNNCSRYSLGNPQATLGKGADRLIADLHLSLYFPKSNPHLIPSCAAERTAA